MGSFRQICSLTGLLIPEGDKIVSFYVKRSYPLETSPNYSVWEIASPLVYGTDTSYGNIDPDNVQSAFYDCIGEDILDDKVELSWEESDIRLVSMDLKSYQEFIGQDAKRVPEYLIAELRDTHNKMKEWNFEQEFNFYRLNYLWDLKPSLWNTRFEIQDEFIDRCHAKVKSEGDTWQSWMRYIQMFHDLDIIINAHRSIGRTFHWTMPEQLGYSRMMLRERKLINEIAAKRIQEDIEESGWLIESESTCYHCKSELTMITYQHPSYKQYLECKKIKENK